MKHLFLIHSSITFYISLSVIKQLALSQGDVVLLYRRGYKNDITKHSYQEVNIDSWGFKHPLSVSNILNNRHYLYRIDKHIHILLKGSSYIYYTPSVSSFNDQAFITHPLCKGYNFIEEGIANYRPNLYKESAIKRSIFISILSKLFNLLHTRLELNNSFLGYYNKSSYVPSYYYMDNEYHRNNKLKGNIILVPMYNEDYREILDYSYCNVFILSALIESNICSIENFTKSLHYLYSKLHDSDVLFVKFHPAQSSRIKDLVFEISSQYHINIKEIDNSYPFEQIILTSKNLTLYGYESSLLFYSRMLKNDCRQYSLSGFLSEVDPNYKLFLSRFPEHVLINDYL